MIARDLDAEFLVQRREEPFLGFLPDAHGAVALDVGVAPDRAGPGAALAEVALKQQEVDDFPEWYPPSAAAGSHRGPSR